jgi:hypothetical protein
MTIDPSNFEAQGKPTAEQARTIYDSLPHQTCDTLVAELTKRGFKISRATAARWIKSGFKTKEKSGPAKNMEVGKVRNIPAVMRDTEAMIGSPLTKQEIDTIQSDLDELGKLGMPDLKAMLEKERLVYNIMMLRHSQRVADKLVLIPRDSAAFVVAMTDAAESIPTVPTGNLGDDAKLINATVNPPNPVSEGIAAFKKRHAAAA